MYPPKKTGDASTFKEDGTSFEIHHEGQNPDGPYKEMHRDDHRRGENYRKNHPQVKSRLQKSSVGNLTKIDRNIGKQSFQT
ncbi:MULTISPECIES: HNH/ENDO VII family nuclease [Sphingobacterium]|uniref:HNH/ENDO VII family nuclease n=1 Tax=Sphingobacterium TaxID=28453 RepID=UPI00257F38E8|nr:MULTISPECIES: HNH/ENDO VII family nuclease [Sphingobacterium]